MTEKIYTIDATDKKLGRIATEAAHVLMGKHETSYTRNNEGEGVVIIENAHAMAIEERKKESTLYFRHSGYRGNQKKETLGDVLTKKGAAEAIQRTIYGMLPKNKLKKRMLARLFIKDTK